MKLMMSEAPVLQLSPPVYLLAQLRTFTAKIPINMSKVSTDAVLPIPWSPRSEPLRSALPSPIRPDPPLYPRFPG